MQTHRTDPSPTPSGSIGRIGRYKLVRPLSKGGMALVYEARRDSLAGVSPRVAVKLILPEHADSLDFKDMFINEARLGASMHHQNLVQIQDFDAENDTYFLVMEYVEGFTLRKMISLAERAGIYIPFGVIAEIGRQACDGLHYAHTAKDEEGRALNLVHRDIKPSNLILGPHGVVKILDFGISKGRLRVERKGAVRGTWGYMAPEQAMGSEVGPTADLFGLAVVLYELASLQPMFSDDRKDEIRRKLRDDHAARLALTLDPRYGAMIGVLVRALQRDPAARFESAEAFGRALSELVNDPITARDELTAFYQQISEVNEGLPAGVPSDADETPVPADATPMDIGGVAAIAGGLTATFAAAAGLVAVGGLVWWMQQGAGEVVLAEVPRPPALAAGTPPAAAVAQAPAPAPRRNHSRVPLSVNEEAASQLFNSALPPAEMLVEPIAAEPAPPEAADQLDGAAMPLGSELGTIERVSYGGPSTAASPTGLVSINARQPSEIYIDGRFIAKTPYDGSLPLGAHEVSLVVIADKRIKTFEITVSRDGRVRRNFDFDRGDFR